MQKSQPHFTSDQRRELVEEHPWMRRGGLPAAINVKVGDRHSLSTRFKHSFKKNTHSTPIANNLKKYTMENNVTCVLQKTQ